MKGFEIKSFLSKEVQGLPSSESIPPSFTSTIVAHRVALNLLSSCHPSSYASSNLSRLLTLLCLVFEDVNVTLPGVVEWDGFGLWVTYKSHFNPTRSKATLTYQRSFLCLYCDVIWAHLTQPTIVASTHSNCVSKISSLWCSPRKSRAEMRCYADGNFSFHSSRLHFSYDEKS